jgi:hypothetical protein
MKAFELRDVYKSHRPNHVARLEIFSAQYAHCLIDALEDTLLVFPMGDRLAHFVLGGLAPSIVNKRTTYPQSADYSTVGALAVVWSRNHNSLTLSFPR